MSIKKYYATKDNTISNAYREYSNTRRVSNLNYGQTDSLQIFSLYNTVTASTDDNEKSRAIVQFDLSQINTDRSNGDIPASGSVSFYLKLKNYPETTTSPTSMTLVASPLSRSWNEGRGKSFDEEGTNKVGSNWLTASSFPAEVTWTTAGGDFYTANSFEQSFTLADEDYEQDITSLIEDQITGLTSQVTGVIYAQTFNPTTYSGLFSVSEGNVGFILEDANGNTAKFQFYQTSNPSVDADSIKIDLTGVSGQSPFNTAVVTAINSATNLNITASLPADGLDQYAIISQETPGVAGNTVVEYTRNYIGGLNLFAFGRSVSGNVIRDVYSTETGNAAFVSGSGFPHFGMIVKLSSSQEEAAESYYKKSFYSRQYNDESYRPQLEARWNNSLQDDTDNFFLSSSRASSTDNLNTIYLYNQIRGNLKNIPAVGTSDILVSFYSGSSTTPSGSKLGLPVGGGVVTDGDTNATGSYVSPGIYSVSVAFNSSSLEYIYPVWHSGSVEYHTGSAIEPQARGTVGARRIKKYFLSITNLKEEYLQNQVSRLRLYVRDPSASPTIYTTAQSTLEATIISKAYYKIYRERDNFEIISYGTGSGNNEYTRLSYDSKGNYFDLDFSVFPKEEDYVIKFLFEEDGQYREQRQKFKFRVV